MAVEKRQNYSNLARGKEVENRLAQLFNKVVSSTKEQDIKEHWDINVVDDIYLVPMPMLVNFETKIDVKSIKHVKMGDGVANEDIHFVEIKNVKGHHGWLYGEAHAFAFETRNSFVIVEKKTLQEFIKKKVKKEYVTKAHDSLYKLYKRDKDLITMVKTVDLSSISSLILSKDINIEE